MSESGPWSPETHILSCVEKTSVARVSFDDLARVPAQRLARLLLDRAAEDPNLLARLYETVDVRRDVPHPTRPGWLIGNHSARSQPPARSHRRQRHAAGRSTPTPDLERFQAELCAGVSLDSTFGSNVRDANQVHDWKQSAHSVFLFW